MIFVPAGSPFTSIARVNIDAMQKRNVLLSSKDEDYFHEMDETKSWLQCLKAVSALKSEGDTHSDGSIAKPWRLCTVQQVEDLKTLIRIHPVWSSSLFLAIPIAVQWSMTVLQALAMDRQLGANFKIPAGPISVVVLISIYIFIALFDRFLLPTWQKFFISLEMFLVGIGESTWFPWKYFAEKHNPLP
ncbi:hypothetical protein REPUB_Repub11eG0176300 [Reevesia pubescens]